MRPWESVPARPRGRATDSQDRMDHPKTSLNHEVKKRLTSRDRSGLSIRASKCWRPNAPFGAYRDSRPNRAVGPTVELELPLLTLRVSSAAPKEYPLWRSAF